MPSPRVQELETLLRTIRHAGNVLLNIDMWDRWGSQHASEEEKAQYGADAGEAMTTQARAKGELERLVTRTRSEAPTEIEAWADAHDKFLAAFIADCTKEGKDETAAFVARGEREQWAQVRSGTLLYVDENVYYVTIDPVRYRELFGIDP
jgi:hypothetical protein